VELPSSTNPRRAHAVCVQPAGRRGRRTADVAVAAHRWLEEVYDPVVAAVPASLQDRFPPPEIFPEILEHRWYMSEAAGQDVGTTAAARSYFDTVLPAVPQPVSTRADADDLATGG